MKRIAMAVLSVTLTWAWAAPARAYIAAGAPEGSCCSDEFGEGSSHWSEGIGLENGHWGCMHGALTAGGGKPKPATASAAVCKKGGNPLIDNKGKAIVAKKVEAVKKKTETAAGGQTPGAAGRSKVAHTTVGSGDKCYCNQKQAPCGSPCGDQ